jgi:hypothetical protein
MFNLPILRFDAKNELHNSLATSAADAERAATHVEIPEGMKFQRARNLIRIALKEFGLSQRIDSLVEQLLDTDDRVR